MMNAEKENDTKNAALWNYGKKRTPSWWLKKLRKQETLLRLLAAWTSCETVKFVEVEIEEEEEEEEKDDDDDDDEGGGGGGVM